MGKDSGAILTESLFSKEETPSQNSKEIPPNVTFPEDRGDSASTLIATWEDVPDCLQCCNLAAFRQYQRRPEPCKILMSTAREQRKLMEDIQRCVGMFDANATDLRLRADDRLCHSRCRPGDDTTVTLRDVPTAIAY